jgi:DNA polymerase-3 subunit epsilon
MNFIAFDVETANSDLSSICQIGFAQFIDGVMKEQASLLVNPRDQFDPLNTWIHGIDESSVRDAPTFVDLAPFITNMLSSSIIAIHTHFDRSAVYSAALRHEVTLPDITWLDTARVARRTWSDLAQRGFGLGPVAARLGIEFKHHDAAEDARAAGEILLHAIRETGMSLLEWLTRVEQPITPRTRSASVRITREGNPEGPLHGEVVVFTGGLSLRRRDAADLIASAGCKVSASVTNKTTVLVVGDQDAKKLAGHDKSSKHRDAEERIRQGQPIRILRESDFMKMATCDGY